MTRGVQRVEAESSGVTNSAARPTAVTFSLAVTRPRIDNQRIDRTAGPVRLLRQESVARRIVDESSMNDGTLSGGRCARRVAADTQFVRPALVGAETSRSSREVLPQTRRVRWVCATPVRPVLASPPCPDADQKTCGCAVMPEWTRLRGRE